MSTVIFKWDPTKSGFTMYEYLDHIVKCNEERTDLHMSWKILDNNIATGDRFYFIKLGPNGAGIIGRGLIKARAYTDVDWTGKGRDVHYVDLKPEIFINPDALPIITMDMLKAVVKNYDWDNSFSGVILPNDAAQRLELLWDRFVLKCGDLFKSKAADTVRYNDMIYLRSLR